MKKNGALIETLGDVILMIIVVGLSIYLIYYLAFQPAETSFREVVSCSGPSAMIGWGECIPKAECSGRSTYGWTDTGLLSCDKKQDLTCCILPSIEEEKWFKPGSFIIRYKEQNRRFFPTDAQRNVIQTGLMIDASTDAAKAEPLIFLYLPRKEVKLDTDGKRIEVQEQSCTLTVINGQSLSTINDCYETSQQYGGDLGEVYFWQGTVGDFTKLTGASGKMSFSLVVTSTDASLLPPQTHEYKEIIEFRQ